MVACYGTVSTFRDVARAHRLCIETATGRNGSRYILAASDRSGELFTWELQALLSSMFPQVARIGGEEMDNEKPVKPTYDALQSLLSFGAAGTWS